METEAGSGTEEIWGDSNTWKKQRASVFWSLTLPEGRLQLSNAVSTRFLSAENILKIL